MRRFREQYPEELVVIGVHSAKFPSEKLTASIRQAVMRHGIEHPVVNDAGFKIWNAYAVRAWPTLTLIDPHGRIAGEVSGEILAEDFAENINELIRLNADIIDRTPLDLRPEIQIEPDSPLRYPSRLLIAENTMYVADTGHHRVLEIGLDGDGLGGEVQRVFGSGEAGLRDGPPNEAAFHQPHGLGLRDGTLYVADTENHAVRAIDLETGAVRTVAGTGQKAHGRLTLGRPTETPLRSPWAVLPLGEHLLIAMAGSHQIWVLVNDQQLGPFAGNGFEALVDGPVAESSFNQPSDLDYGMGYLFVADPEASAVRAISLADPAQTVTLVGQGLFDYGDQDGPTQTALLQHAAGLAVAEREIYITDTYNNKIKVLDPLAGQVRTLIGSGQRGSQDGSFEEARLFEPEGVQVSNGRLYIADTNNHRLRVADLVARQVHTFRLRGIERLPAAAPGGAAVTTLPPREISPGRVRLVLEVRLPEGYKPNPDVPTVVEAGEDSRSEQFFFQAGQEIAWEMDVEADQNLPVSLTYYYCQAQDAQLCLIHDRRMVVPLKVKPGAPAEVHIPIDIEGDG